MDKEFKIRTYGRTELAIEYNPQLSPRQAWRKLQQWIDHHPTLRRELQDMGCYAMRTWPPAAVELVVERLGEP